MKWYEMTSWLTRSAGSAASGAASAVQEGRRAVERAELEAELKRKAEAQRLQQEKMAQKAAQQEMLKDNLYHAARRKAAEQLKSFGYTPTPELVKKQVDSKFTWANQQFVASQQEMRSDVIEELLKLGGITYEMPQEQREVIIQTELKKKQAENALKAGETALAQALNAEVAWIEENNMLPPLPVTMPILAAQEFPRLHSGDLEYLAKKAEEELELWEAAQLAVEEKAAEEQPEWAMGIYDPSGKNRENLRTFVGGLLTALGYVGLPGEQWSAALNYIRLRRIESRDPNLLTTEDKLFLDTAEKYGISELGMQGKIIEAYRDIPSPEMPGAIPWGLKGWTEAMWPGYWVGVGMAKKVPIKKPTVPKAPVAEVVPTAVPEQVIPKVKPVVPKAVKPIVPEVAPKVAAREATIDFTTLNRKEVLAKLAEREQAVILRDIDVLTSKVGSPAKGIQLAETASGRPVLIHGGLKKGVTVDGFVLIEDKAVAQEVLGKFIERQKNLEISRLVKAGASRTGATSRITAGYAELAKGQFPRIEEVYPKELGAELKLVGVQAREMPTGVTAWLSDGKNFVPVDADRLAFMHKYLPEAKMFGAATNPSKSATTFIVGKQKKGLLMPMFIQEVPDVIQSAAKPIPKVTPKVAPKAVPEAVTPAVTPAEAVKELKDARAAHLQAGGIRPPHITIGEGAVGKSLTAAGVEIAPKPVRKGLFTTLGLSPMRVVSRSDPAAAEITRLGRRAYIAYEAKVIEGVERTQRAFKGISLPELEKLVVYQEKGLLTPAFISKLPPQYQRAINEGFHWFNKEIKHIAQTELGIDTSKWSYTELNYFHHLFVGDQMLKVGGKTQAIGKLGVLYEKAEALIAQGTPPADISIMPKFSQMDVPTTLLKREGFWSLISRLSKNMEVESTDLLAEMRGVVGIRPRPKFVGAFQPRQANLQGYMQDPRRVYAVLWDRVMRKQYLEPFTKKATSMVKDIKTPWLRAEMEEYIKSVGGKYIDSTYVLGLDLSKFSTMMVRLQSRLKLGYRPSTALLNRFQAFQLAAQELRGHYFIAEWKRLTPGGKQIIEKLNIRAQRPKFTTGAYGERGTGREPLWKPLGMFSKSEMEVREAAGLGAYLRGIEKFKMTEKQALEYAEDMITATQFRYDVSDLPRIFRNPIGRMAFQFKPFVINYVANAFDVLTLRPLAGLEKYAPLMYPTLASKIERAGIFLGTNLAVGGLKTIHRLFTPYSSGGILVYLAIRHPEVFKGMLHYAGVDMSERAGASPFELMPQDAWDLMGLPAGDIQRFYWAVKKYEKSGDPQDLIAVMKIAPEGWAIYRAFTTEEGVQPTAFERVLIALGFEPTRLSDIKSGMRYIHYTTPKMRTQVQGMPTEAALENMVYYVTQREDVDPRRKQVCLEILEDSGIMPEDYYKYLLSRSKRLG